MKFLKSLLITAVMISAPLIARAESSYESMSRDKTVIVFSTVTAAVASSTFTLLVDLSDITNYAHKETGEIDISRIDIEIDKLAASTGTVKIGVVDSVSSASGTVTWFARQSFEKNVSNTVPLLSINMEQALIHTHSNPYTPGGNPVGTTPYILSIDRLLQSTAIQNDVNLPSPTGNAFPGLGDIILSVSNNDITNTFNVITNVYYHTHGKNPR